MTPDPDPRTRLSRTLAVTLATIAGEIGGLDRELLEHHVRTRTPEWERRLPEVLDAARGVLGPELLRGLPMDGYVGLDGPGVLPFILDGAEPA